MTATINETVLGPTQALAYRGNDNGYVDPDTGLIIPGPIEGWLDEYTNFKYQMKMRMRALMGGLVIRDGTATVTICSLVYVDSQGVVRTVGQATAQALTLNATNYIYVADGATAFTVSTTAPTAAWLQLATVVVGSTDISTNADGTWQITDLRGGYILTGRPVSNYPGESQPIQVYSVDANNAPAGSLLSIVEFNSVSNLYAVQRIKADGSYPYAAEYVCDQEIASNGTGLVYSAKIVTGLDTSGATNVGDPVYLSEANIGEWQYTEPSTSGHIKQVVGWVKVKDATVGEIAFKPSMPILIP